MTAESQDITLTELQRELCDVYRSGTFRAASHCNGYKPQHQYDQRGLYSNRARLETYVIEEYRDSFLAAYDAGVLDTSQYHIERHDHATDPNRLMWARFRRDYIAKTQN